MAMREFRHPLTILIFVFLFNPISLFAQWIKMDLPRPEALQDDWLATMEWADSLSGFVFERSGIYYKTTDGGETWKLDSLDLPSVVLYPDSYLEVATCDFATPDLGIVTISPNWGEYVDTILCVTTDGGDTWSAKNIQNLATYWQPSRVFPEENGSLVKFYGRFFYPVPGSGEKKIYGETMYRSYDLGDSWQLVSVDTFDNQKDIGFAHSFLYVDSLRSYRFSFLEGPEVYHSSAKMTTDGGKTWVKLGYPNLNDHPLQEGKIGGRRHQNIHRVNDTGLVVVMSYLKSGRHSFGMATMDVTQQDTTVGWYRFDAERGPYGDYVVDMSYIDGWAYYLTTRGMDHDTLWVRHLAGNGKLHGFKAPRIEVDWGYQALYTPTNDRVFLLTRYDCWRFDRSVVSTGELPRAVPQSDFNIFPQPVEKARHGTLTIHSDAQVKGDITIQAYNLLGREVGSFHLAATEWRNGVAHIPTRKLLGRGAVTGVYLIVFTSDNALLSVKSLLVY